LVYTTITKFGLNMSDPYDLGQVGRITQIQGEIARIELGGGTAVTANIALTDAKVGDYVMVHAGYVLKVLDIQEAERLLAQWR
jgi:hydrogenase expression/formation protein HypC